MITLPGYDHTRWGIKVEIRIVWDWMLTGIHWDITPGMRQIYGTILVPFILVITETLLFDPFTTPLPRKMSIGE